MGLNEERERAERELEHLSAAIEAHEADASPTVLNAYAAMANLTGMIVFSDAVGQGTQSLRQSCRPFCTTSSLSSAGRSASANPARAGHAGHSLPAEGCVG